MPTVVREDGLIIRVYGPPREHPPPHVHVELGSDQLVVIRLATRFSAPMVWAVYRMKRRDVVRAFRLVEKHHVAIESAWRKIHG